MSHREEKKQVYFIFDCSEKHFFLDVQFVKSSNSVPLYKGKIAAKHLNSSTHQTWGNSTATLTKFNTNVSYNLFFFQTIPYILIQSTFIQALRQLNEVCPFWFASVSAVSLVHNYEQNTDVCEHVHMRVKKKETIAFLLFTKAL